MSATDDASLPPRPSLAFRATRAAAITGAALLGALAAAAFGPLGIRSLALYEATVPWHGAPPGPGEWPRPPRAGERAEARGGMLVVAGRHPGETAWIASALSAERRSGAEADHARRGALQRAAAAGSPFGPRAPLPPGAATLAALRAEARAVRALAGPAPAGDGPPPDGAEGVMLGAIAEAAGHGDPALLHDALAAARVLERERLEREAAAPAADPRRLRDGWERRLQRLAVRLDGLAAGLEATLPADAAEAAALAVPELAGAAGAGHPLPSDAWRANAAPARAPALRALPGPALGFGVAGGALGLGLGLAFAALAGSRRRTASVIHAGREPRDVAAGAAWLQLVSGARARDVAAGVMEIVARSAAAGGRVLVVDGGRSLALHRAFARERRPGLVDCLTRPLPVLGVVQQGGAPRVLLLAHGDPRRRPPWIHLDRLLEDVRPHCDRVVLALPPDAPREIGSVLAGRLMDGWWAVPAGRRGMGASRMTERLGIAFHGLDLESGPAPSLERLRARIAALAPPPIALPAAEARVEAAPPRVAIEVAAADEVLDTDTQVRERLRFLAWMRRVQAEGRREELVSPE